MKSNSDLEILKQKKKPFLYWIDIAVQSFKINKSISVRFWEFNEKEHFGNARAHIHLDTNIVCISEEELTRMSEEEIKETAIHEITHILEKGHEATFYKILDEELISNWNPSNNGIIRVSDNRYTINLVGDQIKENHCNYHLCHKTDKKLKKCSYCKQLFCKEHINPREPSSKLFHKDSHPCLAYVIKKEETKKEKTIQFPKKRIEIGIDEPPKKTQKRKYKKKETIRIVSKKLKPKESFLSRIRNIFR